MKIYKIDIFGIIHIEGLGLFSAILISICALLIAPLLIFTIGYLIGFISKLLIGNLLVEAFSYFGFDIPVDKIPLITGLIAWIAPWFKSNNKVEKDNLF